MLIVKTILKETKNKGIGLFADEFLPVGKKIWVNEILFTIEFKKDLIDMFPQVAKDFIDKYAWTEDRKTFFVNLDNERFVNHSENPNAYYDNETSDMFALRDIQVGEEILVNYRTFDLISESDLGFEVKE